jgi:hypothetical protein
MVCQNIDLYRIKKPRSIPKVYENFDLYRIPKPRFISHTKT